MAPIDNVKIELSVVIGECEMPLKRLLQMSRGAFIPLGGDARKELEVRANAHKIGAGRVVLDGDAVTVEFISKPGAAA